MPTTPPQVPDAHHPTTDRRCPPLYHQSRYHHSTAAPTTNLPPTLITFASDANSLPTMLITHIQLACSTNQSTPATFAIPAISQSWQQRLLCLMALFFSGTHQFPPTPTTGLSAHHSAMPTSWHWHQQLGSDAHHSAAMPTHGSGTHQSAATPTIPCRCPPVASNAQYSPRLRCPLTLAPTRRLQSSFLASSAHHSTSAIFSSNIPVVAAKIVKFDSTGTPILCYDAHHSAPASITRLRRPPLASGTNHLTSMPTTDISNAHNLSLSPTSRL